MTERLPAVEDTLRTWAEILDRPHPAFGHRRPDGRPFLPLTHPHWPYYGSLQNTDRYYDQYVAEYGAIPGYEPSVERGYPVKPEEESDDGKAV